METAITVRDVAATIGREGDGTPTGNGCDTASRRGGSRNLPRSGQEEGPLRKSPSRQGAGARTLAPDRGAKSGHTFGHTGETVSAQPFTGSVVVN